MKRTLLLLLLPTLAFAATRVVSTSPQVTELLFELGHGAAVVATSELSDYPEAAKAIPRLGPLLSPSLERAVRFEAQWALFDDTAPVPVFKAGARATHMKVFEMKTGRVERFFSEAERLLTEVFGDGRNAALARARSRWTSSTKPERTESFLAFVWLSPPILFGPSTFLSDVLEHHGGKNLLPSSWALPYPQMSEEWIVRRVPDRIYVLDDLPDADKAAEAVAKRWWPGAEVRRTVLSRHRFARATLAVLEEKP